jgi:hypothetical protein
LRPYEVLPNESAAGSRSQRERSRDVLSVSPLEEDHWSLQAITGHSKWTLFKADRLPAALAIFQQQVVSVVVCERDLRPGTWIDMLDYINDLPHPPSLIVTSS